MKKFMQSVLIQIKKTVTGVWLRWPVPAETAAGLLVACLVFHAALWPLPDDSSFEPLRPRPKIPDMMRASPPPTAQPATDAAGVAPAPVKTVPAVKTPEHRFHPIIVRAANRYRIDPALVKAIIKAESGYNARAVSKSGAMGLMQLMPGTAEELGVKDSFDPEHNINGGVRYFRD